MTAQLRTVLAGPALLALFVPSSFGQSLFASKIEAVNQGTGTGTFVLDNILGAPEGGGITNGSLDVLTLGNGGDVTLGFDVTITDGPGADLIVSENPLVFSGGVFAEVVHVEVSTNGIDFARFPVRYAGPQGPLGAFDVLPWGAYSQMSGGTPVVANASIGNVDPFDPVEAGGDTFDLAELADHPLVQSGLVDLTEIHFVRLVDYVAGTDVDERGITIWDSGGDSSADIDAVTVIQHVGNQSASAPTVDFWRDNLGFTHLVIEDPDGFSDLNGSELRVSVNLMPVPFYRLRDYFVLQSMTPEGVHLISPTSAQAAGLEAVLAVSVEDGAGQFSADQITLNP